MSTSINYTRPKLADYQKEIIDCEQRFACIEASTKSGKTTAMIVWLTEQALRCKNNQSVFWVAPVFTQSLIAFNRARSMISNRSFFKVNETRMTLTMPHGSIMAFKSGDNPDTLYGDDCYAAVIDEASRIKEDSWIAVRSTLTKTEGKCKLIGNVKGRNNFFFKMCQDAKYGKENYFYKKITILDAIKAGITSQLEYEQVQQDMSEERFRELYLCEPSEDGGNPFGFTHIAGCIKPMSNLPAVCYGIDLGKSVDYTCIIGLDRYGSVCDFRHFQKPWEDTTREINNLPDISMLIDSTGLGDPVLEMVQKTRSSAEGFKFTQISKRQLIEGLIVAIQKRLISFPDNTIRKELDYFEYMQTRTGNIYSAPSGYHDDAVCALALAWRKYQEAGPAADGPSVW